MKWYHRRLRHAERQDGGVKELDEDGAGVDGEVEAVQTEPSVDTDFSGVSSRGARNFIPELRKKPTIWEYGKEAARLFRRQMSDKTEADFHPAAIVDSTAETIHHVPRAYDDVDNVVLDAVLDRSDEPRGFGMGFFGNLVHREYNTKRRSRAVRQQLDDLEDYRPYFTYWISTVQIIVMIIGMCWYGLAPFGVELRLQSGFVRTETLTQEKVAYYEPPNFWVGPRAADLIRLGAKFSPCMRNDPQIEANVRDQRLKEARDTGCCVRNDGSGCLQTSRDKCSPLLSTFHKWSKMNPGPDGRAIGPVCGQDPRYCSNPVSRPPHLWPDDLRSWPICSKRTHAGFGSPDHMTCKETGKPCCIGIHGRCELRSEEYCRFVNGHFHPEASLCSQVSCLQDVCGMLSFTSKGYPDQVYRLWTPLFIHAGLVHLVITLLVQWFFMRDLERLCGPLRMAMIYFGSGIVGYSASAIFVPYRQVRLISRFF